jgi:hypothetical protein
MSEESVMNRVDALCLIGFCFAVAFFSGGAAKGDNRRARKLSLGDDGLFKDLIRKAAYVAAE